MARFKMSIVLLRDNTICKNVYDARKKHIFLFRSNFRSTHALFYDRRFLRYLFLAQSFFFRVKSSLFCPSKSEGLFSSKRLERIDLL